jgi:hypothetical protein
VHFLVLSGGIALRRIDQREFSFAFDVIASAPALTALSVSLCFCRMTHFFSPDGPKDRNVAPLGSLGAEPMGFESVAADVWATGVNPDRHAVEFVRECLDGLDGVSATKVLQPSTWAKPR